jgi:hypothetical protein
MQITNYLASLGIGAPIKEIREMHKVFLVIFEKGYHQRPRFVSKCAVKPDKPEPIAISLESRYRRHESNQWMAQIVGTHPKYKLDRRFLEADRAEWGKRGWAAKEYHISEGYYQFQESGQREYIRVFQLSSGELDWETVDYHEVLEAFGGQPKSRV